MGDYSQAYAGGGQDSKTKEARLLDLLSRIRSQAASYFAVHMHFSLLRASHRQPHFMRMAQRTVDSLSTKQDVEVFTLGNGDVVMLCRNVPVDDVDDVVFRLRTIFHEDPLTQAEDGSADDQFSTWYDMSQQADFKGLEDSVQVLAKQAEAARDEQAEALSTGRASKAMDGAALEPEMLTAINQKMLEVRIGDLVRRQTAVSVKPKEGHKLAFREHYVAMEGLRKRIAPNINLFANNWLFQYLSETLDARVLEVLSRLDFAEQDAPISVNLNIATLSARPFQNFNAIVGEHTNKVIIELQAIDIFSDMGGFNRARDWLKERGYRVLVDGLSPLTLHFFDASKLGADHVKISWGPEVRGGVGQDQTDRIKAVAHAMPHDGVVLARVDSEEGISWGLGLGITCFQGHYIDRVVEMMQQKGLI